MISVIIPAFNEEQTLGRCLDSLADQSCARHGYEVIVVDDGSSDRTAEIAQVRGVKCIRQENQGPAVARNRGVREASGEIILFTDSDCIPDHRWVEEMAAPFADTNIVGVKGAYRTQQRGIVPRFAQLEFEARYRRMRKERFVDFVDSYSAGFRKSVFSEVGGFDPNFPVANNEDVDLSYKLSRAGYKMVFNPRAAVYHQHPETLWRYLKLKFLRAYWRIIVYKRYPMKILHDSYTPQSLKLEIFFVYMALLATVWGIFSHWGLPIGLGSLGIFLLLALPFTFEALRKDPLVGLFTPLVLVLRSLVFGLGVLAGVLSKKRRDLLFPVLFLVSDAAMVFVAFLGAYWLRVGVLSPFLEPFTDPFSHNLADYLRIFGWILALSLLVFSFMGLYRRVRSITRFSEFALVFKTVSLAVLLVMAGAYLYKYDISRPVVVLFWALSVTLLNVSRFAIRGLQSAMLRKGYNVIRALILGCNPMGAMVLKKVRSHPELGYKVVGFLDTAGSGLAEYEALPIFGGIRDILTVIERERVDEVFIADPGMSHQEILDLIVHCEKARVSFRIVSDLFDIVTRPVDLDDVADIPVVDLAPGGGGWMGTVTSRLTDLILGAVLLVCLAPFWALIMILLWVEGIRPAVEREERVGKGREHFLMYRFRTVRGTGEASGEGTSLIAGVLRRTGLDESLQVINVIRGEMSLVGPRPEIPSIAGQYEEWQNKRFDVKPGITGLWQIAGHRDLPIHRNLEYDFYYIKNRSLMLDLSILLRTAFGILLGQPWRKRA